MRKITISDIHAKIAEHSKIALYSSLSLTKKRASSGEVGIWWFVKDTVIALRETIENVQEDSFMCVEQEHVKVWPFVQKEYSESFPDILDVKYNEVERGRVWWSPGEKRFVITCSKNIKENPKAIQKIKEWFGIENKMCLVRNDPQYDVCEIKIK